MISLLLPTRKRPANLERLLQSLIENTLASHNVEIVIRYDNDDRDTANAIGKLSSLWCNIRFIQMSRPARSGALWNQALTAASGEILMICADDLIFRTKNWDKLVTDTFNNIPDKIATVYGADGIHNQGLGTHPFLHRKWVNAMGCISQDNYTYMLDVWWHQVAEMLGRAIFVPELVTEHMHYCNNKAVKDETYQKNCDAAVSTNEHQRYYSPEETARRSSDAEKLRQLMA